MSRPSHAAWYSADKVAEIERRALPEYFDDRSAIKTPASYMQMRNLIINMYHEAPGLHLSVTECRRHLAADAGAVMRLHQFLEHWGLINYNAASPGAPAGLVGTVTLDGPVVLAGSLASSLPLPTPVAPSSGGGAGASAGAAEWDPKEILTLVEALEACGSDGEPASPQPTVYTQHPAQHPALRPVVARLARAPPPDRPRSSSPAHPFALAVAAASWDDIAQQVGKPAEECIAHFLSLPIAEPRSLPLSGVGAAGDADSGVSDMQLAQLALLTAAAPDAPDGATNGAGVKRQKTENGGTPLAAAAGELRASARELLGSVEARAAQMLDDEKASLASLVASAVDTQMRRVELKLTQLDELSTLLQREKEHLERTRHIVFAERLAFDSRRAQQPPPPLSVAAVHLSAPNAAAGAAESGTAEASSS
jgi:SWI/SNF related-matrix-associated actin-dependent regulator of chromatin subfamily C